MVGFTFRGVRIRFTFGFFAVWSVLILFGQGRIARIALFSCILHEAGHIAAMGLMRIRVRRLTFYSGGIAMESSPPMEIAGFRQELAVLSAGCAVNGILAAAAALTGDRLTALVNLALLLFNLLPFSALDGGRMLHALGAYFLPAADIEGALRVTDLAFGIAAAVFFISRGSVSFTLPLTLALILFESLSEGKGT